MQRGKKRWTATILHDVGNVAAWVRYPIQETS